MSNNKNMNISFSFIDGSGELSNLKMSSSRNEFPLDNLNSFLFEFACLDIKLVQILLNNVCLLAFRMKRIDWK